MFKKFFNKTSIILISFIVFLFVSGAIIYVYPIIDTKNAEKTIISEFNNATRLSGDGTTKTKDGFQYFKSGRYEVVLSQFDLNKPLYCFVNSSNDSPTSVYVQSISMNRKSYNDFEVLNYTGGVTRSLSFDEIVNTCKKGDITKQNLPLDKFNIIPPVTPIQIEKTQKDKESATDRIKNQNTFESKFGTDLKGKYSLCVEYLKAAQSFLDAKERGDKSYFSIVQNGDVNIEKFSLENVKETFNNQKIECDNIKKELDSQK